MKTEKTSRGELNIQWYGVIVPTTEKSSYDHPIHAYDLVKLANNWIETEEGVLVLKNGVLLITKEQHSAEAAKYIRDVELGDKDGLTIAKMLPFRINFKDMEEIELIKPYRTFLSSEDEIKKHLEMAEKKELCKKVASDPKSEYSMSVYDDSLFYAPSIDKVVLSKDIRPEYKQKEGQIIKFFRRLVQEN